MDAALKVESRYFAHVLQTKEAAAMIRSLFVSMQELNKGARRPKGEPPRNVKKLGVLGAGFMGAGIAYVSAQAGIDVVLLDRDMPSAEKGKAHSERSERQGGAARRDERRGEGRRCSLASSRPTTMPILPAPTSSSRRCSRIAA